MKESTNSASYLCPAIICLIVSVFPSQASQIISLNIPQLHFLSPNSHLAFQISNSLSPMIGIFNISLSNIDTQDLPYFIITRQSCNMRPKDQNILFKKTSTGIYPQNIGISFFANTSDDICFNVILLDHGDDNKNKSFKVQVFFNRVNDFVLPNKPFSFNLEKQSEKDFVYDSEDDKADIIYIKISPLSNSSQTSNIELKHFEGICIESSVWNSWLCKLNKPKRIITFSLYSISEKMSYNIFISKVEPQIIDSSISKSFFPLIPSFGTLVSLNVSEIGILHLKAQLEDNHHHLPLIVTDSLSDLFIILSKRKNALGSERNESKNKDWMSALIWNYWTNKKWYAFIPLATNQSFSFISNFMKQRPINLDHKVSLYLDPETNAYEHFELKMDPIYSSGKYEIILEALQENSLIHLYCTVNSYDIIPYVTTENNALDNQVLAKTSSDNKLTLSFFAAISDLSVSITVHALKKGFYTLTVRKVGTTNDYSSFLITNSITCISLLVFLSLAASFWCNRHARITDNELFSEREQEISPTMSDVQESGSSNLQIVIDRSEETRNQSPQIIKQTLTSDKDLSKETACPFSDISTQQENEENMNMRCDICYEKKKVVQFNPCNHACACTFCAFMIIQTSAKCPLCRAKIRKVKLNVERQE